MVKRGNELREVKPFLTKKSQITLFIIVAILIVAVIILFFLLRGKEVTDIIRPEMPDPNREVRQCVEDNVRKAVDFMLPQGGYVNVSNYKLYNGEKVEYLCYTNQYYYPCINQKPMYIQSLEAEIHDYVRPRIKKCFNSLIDEYRGKGYEVGEEPLKLKVGLRPKQIEVGVKKDLSLSKGEKSIQFKEGRYGINSPLYNLAVVAQEITSQEAKFCNFEYIGYALFYPSFEIEKDQVGFGETTSDIYKIKDKNTGKTLNIAIRSCAMPGGL